MSLPGGGSADEAAGGASGRAIQPPQTQSSSHEDTVIAAELTESLMATGFSRADAEDIVRQIQADTRGAAAAAAATDASAASAATAASAAAAAAAAAPAASSAGSSASAAAAVAAAASSSAAAASSSSAEIASDVSSNARAVAAAAADVDDGGDHGVLDGALVRSVRAAAASASGASVDDAQLKATVRRIVPLLSDWDAWAAVFDGALPPALHAFESRVTRLLELFDAIEQANELVLNAFRNAIEMLCLNIRYGRLNMDKDAVVVLGLLLSPAIATPGLAQELATKICPLVERLAPPETGRFDELVAALPGRVLDNFVSSLQTVITLHLIAQDDSFACNDDMLCQAVARVLSVCFKANEKRAQLSHERFYNEELNKHLDVREDFARWYSAQVSDAATSGGSSRFTFCKYAFLLEPATKSDMLFVEARSTMQRRMEMEVFSSMMRMAQPMPYFLLRVRRESILEDTIRQLSGSIDPADMKKKLRIVFVGEQGVDEGGVQKEFFQLLVKRLFNVDYGMFTVVDKSAVFWFNKHSFASSQEFSLVGTLLGLAVYNGVILDVHFPLVVYKKLLGQPVSLDDLKEVEPAIHNSLRELLEYTDDDVEEVFGLTFCLQYMSFDEVKTAELLPNGAKVPVTRATRQQYVDLCVDFYLQKSIAQQFGAFRDGFRRLVDGKAINLFSPVELDVTVRGNPALDFEDLERNTTYDGGFTESSRTVRWLWEILHALDDAQKRRFLFFCTGSDRAPIRGLGSLGFVVARNGPDSDRLPTAHTCFNHLLLPDYESKEKLQRMILVAISNAEGLA